MLPFPPSVNSAYAQRGNRRVKAKGVILWEDKARRTLKTNYFLSKPFTRHEARLVYVLYPKDKRIRDAGNYEKILTDFLVTEGVLIDDSARYVRGITIEWGEEGQGDPGTVRVIITSVMKNS